jgi:hypothetical protein
MSEYLTPSRSSEARTRVVVKQLYRGQAKRERENWQSQCDRGQANYYCNMLQNNSIAIILNLSINFNIKKYKKS